MLHCYKPFIILRCLCGFSNIFPFVCSAQFVFELYGTMSFDIFFFVSSSAFIFFCSVLFVKESHRAFMGLFGLVSYFISSVCYVYFLQHYIIQSTSLLGVLWDVDQRIWFWFSLYSIATFLLFCVCRIFSWMSLFCAFYQSHRIRREKIIDKQRKKRERKRRRRRSVHYLFVCLFSFFCFHCFQIWDEWCLWVDPIKKRSAICIPLVWQPKTIHFCFHSIFDALFVIKNWIVHTDTDKS